MRLPQKRPIPKRFRKPSIGMQASSNLLLVLSMIMFAAGFPAAEYLLDEWSPIALSFARLCIAAAGMVAVWIIVDGWRRVVGAPWMRAMFVGGVGFGFGSHLLLIAQSISDPVTAAIMVTTMPIMGMIMEVFLDGRRITLRLMLGVSATFVGGVFATGTNPQMIDAGAGALIALLATVLFTWGSRATVKSFPDLTSIGRSSITIVGAMMAIAMIFAISLFTGTTTLPPVQSAQNWALLVYYALGALGLSQVFWIMGVGRMGIGMASLHMNMTPFYVMLLMLALGGSWQWGQAVGAGIVAVGVFVAQLKNPLRRSVPQTE